MMVAVPITGTRPSRDMAAKLAIVELERGGDQQGSKCSALADEEDDLMLGGRL